MFIIWNEWNILEKAAYKRLNATSHCCYMSRGSVLNGNSAMANGCLVVRHTHKKMRYEMIGSVQQDYKSLVYFILLCREPEQCFDMMTKMHTNTHTVCVWHLRMINKSTPRVCVGYGKWNRILCVLCTPNGTIHSSEKYLHVRFCCFFFVWWINGQVNTPKFRSHLKSVWYNSTIKYSSSTTHEYRIRVSKYALCCAMVLRVF